MLNEIQASLQTQPVHYWRDKNGHEIDFVIRTRGGSPDAIECKWSADAFDPKNLLAFRRQYPVGRNWVVSADVDQAYVRQIKGVEVRTTGLQTLVSELQS